jgi:hypothetical protein
MHEGRFQPPVRCRNGASGLKPRAALQERSAVHGPRASNLIGAKIASECLSILCHWGSRALNMWGRVRSFRCGR